MNSIVHTRTSALDLGARVRPTPGLRGVLPTSTCTKAKSRDARLPIKVLKNVGITDELRQQFTAEADAMAELEHPYIVPVFSTDITTDGRPFIEMMYYPRPDLGARASTTQFSVPGCSSIQIAGAVETAHRAGILHRDIKPANILTSRNDAPGLTDFGIAAQVAAVDEDDDTGYLHPGHHQKFCTQKRRPAFAPMSTRSVRRSGTSSSAGHRSKSSGATTRGTRLCAGFVISPRRQPVDRTSLRSSIDCCSTQWRRTRPGAPIRHSPSHGHSNPSNKTNDFANRDRGPDRRAPKRVTARSVHVSGGNRDSGTNPNRRPERIPGPARERAQRPAITNRAAGAAHRSQANRHPAATSGACTFAIRFNAKGRASRDRTPQLAQGQATIARRPAASTPRPANPPHCPRRRRSRRSRPDRRPCPPHHRRLKPAHSPTPKRRAARTRTQPTRARSFRVPQHSRSPRSASTTRRSGLAGHTRQTTRDSYLWRVYPDGKPQRVAMPLQRHDRPVGHEVVPYRSSYLQPVGARLLSQLVGTRLLAMTKLAAATVEFCGELYPVLTDEPQSSDGRKADNRRVQPLPHRRFLK